MTLACERVGKERNSFALRQCRCPRRARKDGDEIGCRPVPNPGTWLAARKAFWADPEPNRAALQKNLLSLEAARTRHVGTSPRSELYDPNSWTDEFVMLTRPDMDAIQTAPFHDYRTNVASYPKWQGWLRAAKPPMLVVRGRHDTSFMMEGAHGFGRDNPNAEIHILDASHFPSWTKRRTKSAPSP